MAAGRPRTPTALKILNGNPHGKRLPDNEAVAEGDITEVPDHLSEAQRAGWKYAIAHAPINLLKLIDRATLMTFVVAEDLHRRATIAIEKEGLIVEHPGSGNPMENPNLTVLTKQATVLLRAAAEMGFTPSSRSRCKVSEPAKKVNPFLEFVGDVRKKQGK